MVKVRPLRFPIPRERLPSRDGRRATPQGQPLVCGLGADGSHGASERAGNLGFRHAACGKGGEVADFVVGPAVTVHG